jgi:hypothetical protein
MVVVADVADVVVVGVVEVVEVVVAVGVVAREVIDEMEPKILLLRRKGKKIRRKLEKRGREQWSPTVRMMPV